ncbi:MAG TPA: triose-phosphate isomerase, partial [Flavobacteriales bacterium]|nr:triose-phosphate isomerase [Flavobacteriales bacterium]
MMRTIVAGNWKMNTDAKGAHALVDAVVQQAGDFTAEVQVIIAPPFPFLAKAVEQCAGTPIVVAAQNCH